MRWQLVVPGLAAGLLAGVVLSGRAERGGGPLRGTVRPRACGARPIAAPIAGGRLPGPALRSQVATAPARKAAPTPSRIDPRAGERSGGGPAGGMDPRPRPAEELSTDAAASALQDVEGPGGVTEVWKTLAQLAARGTPRDQAALARIIDGDAADSLVLAALEAAVRVERPDQKLEAALLRRVDRTDGALFLREEAIRKLGRLAATLRAGDPARTRSLRLQLETWLASGEAPLQRAAAFALGTLADPDSREELRRAAESRHPLVRLAARQALAAYRQAGPRQG